MVGAAYIDASALVKLVLEEPESAALREALQGLQLFSSVVSGVEVPRAVARLTDKADRQVRAALRAVEVLELTAAIVSHAAAITPSTLGSSDAVHLASAMALGGVVETLVTYDARLADAAQAAGLAVLAPA